MTWLKDKWMWIVAGLGFVVGAVLFIVTFGRVKPKKPVVPPRPDTPDVKIPEPVIVDTRPSDDYEAEKVEPKADVTADELVDSINSRHR